jgi:hypothetical protein
MAWSAILIAVVSELAKSKPAAGGFFSVEEILLFVFSEQEKVKVKMQRPKNRSWMFFIIFLQR